MHQSDHALQFLDALFRYLSFEVFAELFRVRPLHPFAVRLFFHAGFCEACFAPVEWVVGDGEFCVEFVSFHNPKRLTRRDWSNPLSVDSRGGRVMDILGLCFGVYQLGVSQRINRCQLVFEIP